jgi:hypothetical protein
MKATRLLSLIAIMLFYLLASCSRPKYYTSASFEQKTSKHKLVAILPAEIVLTGNQPKNLTRADIEIIEEEESKAFMQSLYNSILEYANTRKYYTRVNLQDFASTVKILGDNNITLRDSWNKNDEELARLLGVDAVVRMRIRKTRYMSDMASYGVDLAKRISYETGVFGAANRVGIPVPYISNRTNDINASCSLVSNGETLWNDYYKGGANWNNPANQIIEGVTEIFGKHFPYKERNR